MSDGGEDAPGGRRRYGESVQTYPEPFTRVPPPVTETKPGQLTRQQIEHFFEEGYVVVRDYFKPAELQACRDAVDGLVEMLAQKLYKGGKIKSLFREYGTFQRLTALEKAFPGSNILLFKQGKLPQDFMDLWCCEKFINMNEQFLGPDVAGHPVWNLRVKTPFNEITTVPWHQDAAYFSEDSYDHLIVSAWIPFLDTNAHNGGMQVVRKAHQQGRVARHTCCHTDTWYVTLDEEEMERSLGVNVETDVVTCEVPYGGFLLFNNITPHRSLPNFSNDVRWSIDLRWQSPHEKWGFYDITPGVNFRTAQDGIVTPDWEKFLAVNRKEVWQKRHFKEIQKTDDFDTTVTGPWIGRWEIVNRTPHTDAFCSSLQSDSQQHHHKTLSS